MKRIVSISVVAVFLLISSVAISQQKGDFEQSRAWKKLGTRVQSAWLAAKKTGDMSTRLDCFVRIESPADDGDKSFLISNGFNVMVFGLITRGHMQVKDLRRVAELPFVQSIKLSTK
ncbi:MAG: hypothetical protein HN337_10205 [Deltaproteobacteria bacterium]|jgi:hypothetical protein|nr:hypothetical protein [Deltaproteobacteria bacterium]